MKQTNERLCALAQKGDATALDGLIENNKSFIGKVANDLFHSMNLAQSGLNLDTDDLKQAGNLGLWKAVPRFDAARGMKFLTYAAPAIHNAMMDMVRDAFTAFEQRMVTEDKDGIYYQRVSLDDVLPGEEQLRRIEAIADPYAMQPQTIMHYGRAGIAPGTVRCLETADPARADLSAVPLWLHRWRGTSADWHGDIFSLDERPRKKDGGTGHG